ncbi:hypothetical protein BDV98DRAFT_598799 [Pterulicium gracile]|uniref:FAD-binding PCMH-type domain-containing protein n=1 Tax=Pterulicium gracile TaxID=1884261 RepID=A0A5C3PZ18_9AGAR|nr:hypothetical protein BDV98DRAFT_599105 [Pterula gracilis]TFK95227.1 hypothetical protein BDV98DRAFT_598799 [Pterula gracilis]
MPVPSALGYANFIGDVSYSSQTLPSNFTAVCEQIESQFTALESVVYWPGSEDYALHTEHWSLASSLPAACSVAPASPEDVGAILRLVHATSTPFGVKGGGHNSLPGASGTAGVHIGMHKFNEVVYHEDTETAYIGSGLDWDHVYSALGEHDRLAVGGRAIGVGVGGLSLIGGFSWLTAERGLAVDNIIAYQLVLPNGDLTDVSADANPDLFWALKGGGNNFGIVTRFTVNVFEQGPVWGGLVAYPITEQELFIDALMTFNEARDVKAGILTGFHVDTSSSDGSFIFAILFYNGPTAPAGMFDKFLAMPALSNAVLPDRTFLSFLETYVLPKRAGQRMFAENINVKGYTPELIRHMFTEATADTLGAFSVTGIDAAILPIQDTGFKTKALDTAWPPHRQFMLLPAYLEAQFDDATHDSTVRSELQQLRESILQVALAEGQYPSDTTLRYEYLCSAGPAVTLDQIYGLSVARLRQVKLQVDPENIMGLAGGHKIVS